MGTEFAVVRKRGRVAGTNELRRVVWHQIKGCRDKVKKCTSIWGPALVG